MYYAGCYLSPKLSAVNTYISERFCLLWSGCEGYTGAKDWFLQLVVFSLFSSKCGYVTLDF